MTKILIVDDDADLLEVMFTLLRGSGYEVKGITEGEEASEAVASFDPHLLILDVWLSGTDGRDICKKLKSEPETRNLPIIMFSAHPKALESVFDAGADDFIAKPFQIQDLLKKIQRLTKGG